MIKLTLFQRFLLRLYDSVPVGWRPSSTGRSVMYYAFKCPVHGVVVDYRRAPEFKLRCLKCLEEKWK